MHGTRAVADDRRQLERSRRRRVELNRASLVRFANEHGEVLLRPAVFTPGHHEHYYHFLYDLLLPLHEVIRRTRPDTTLCVEDFGILTPRLAEIYPGRTAIVPRERAAALPAHPLLAMNPDDVETDPAELDRFCADVRTVLGIVRDTPQRKVIVVERAPAHPYYRHSARLRSAGAERRHIPNHHEIVSAVASRTGPDHELVDVRLEELDQRRQLQLFNDAALVIAQHGAGLGNTAWMRPGSVVVEISHFGDRDHFRHIAGLRGLVFHRYRTEGPHDPVDVDALLRQLLALDSLAHVLA